MLKLPEKPAPQPIVAKHTAFLPNKKGRSTDQVFFATLHADGRMIEGVLNKQSGT